jgi:hypothetical protein
MGRPIERSTVCCAELIALWNTHQEADTKSDDDNGFNRRPACLCGLLQFGFWMRTSSSFPWSAAPASSAKIAASATAGCGAGEQSVIRFAGDSGRGGLRIVSRTSRIQRVDLQCRAYRKG